MRARNPYTRERDVAQRCETARLARAKKREQEPHAAVRACRSRGRDFVHADHVCTTLSFVDRKWLEEMLDGRRLIKQGAVRIDGYVVLSENHSLQAGSSSTIQVGKRRFKKIKIM